ncbi:hypothetical protein BSU04_26465 [Caballeronia sordidicola]|uniref:Uncharacterized protein n=1 Tax=Caballeronia sordidicola TaxID=196367 RepID=A0A226WXI6_CABSO|nr:hypothetical protein BSU04_26465 [Caballeronia sordidicola]
MQRGGEKPCFIRLWRASCSAGRRFGKYWLYAWPHALGLGRRKTQDLSFRRRGAAPRSLLRLVPLSRGPTEHVPPGIRLAGLFHRQPTCSSEKPRCNMTSDNV